MRSYQYSLQSAAEVGEAWKDIMGNESALCAEIKKEALAACNLLDDYATIKEKLSEVATLDADEFVAEALSSSRSTKLTKKVLELFNEKAR
jgi:predicted metal-binding transcription factor (methanogenesis marker protein 9)